MLYTYILWNEERFFWFVDVPEFEWILFASRSNQVRFIDILTHAREFVSSLNFQLKEKV